MISAKVESMISVGLPSRRLQGIWARERTGVACVGGVERGRGKGNLGARESVEQEARRGHSPSRVSYTIPRRLDFRIPGHMLEKSKIPSTANRDRDTLWLILPSLLWHRGKREGFIEVF